MMKKAVGQSLLRLHGAYRYAIQETFAIPIIDEIKNDGSEGNKNNSSDNNSETNEPEEIIDENEINNISGNDLESLFTSKVV